MDEVLERELKFDIDEPFALPRLDDIARGVAIQRNTVELRSAYYDTPDGDLQTHGVLLRRRDGDDDTGWQLKVPDVEGRVEIRAALSDTPPSELTDALIGMRLGKPLVNVATIRTTRDRYQITDPRSNRLCAEVADDHVRASVDHRLLAWREIEIEVGEDTPPLARRIAKRLTAAGAKRARYPSKLARVYQPARGEPTIGTAAGQALMGYITKQIDAVFDGDLGLRRGSDPIHDTRVAIRRTRSTLRVFGKLLDRDATGDIDDELKWFAGLLGEVRDCQVQRHRFQEALAQLPPELVLGPVANRINTDLQSHQLRARKVVAGAMNSQRYLDLLATLQQWRGEPPLSKPPSLKALKKRARHAERKADRRLAEAIEEGDDELLHRARKAAKRARYAAELCAPVEKRAKETVKQYKRIQTVLGDHQDGVVASATLRRLALTAGTTAGENGFTYGLLYAREQQAAETARRQVRKLVD
ncbi:CYTH and CHAD domain-containing protein [Mycobacterium sp.]|uniref:CYTH and CHAD domain-containing protein n=1 Tax=Mycobacterium sp. TaxID=1785 RepID=UPI002D7F05C6|nr:CYTH and CHAD domain-containing protein [Mycobacterium sp.]